jgi:riboflavin kinase / FMN adenylyltransferase
MGWGSKRSAGFRVFRGPDGVAGAVGPNISVFGKFDGLHLGHRALLDRAADASRRLGMPCGAVTFERHPDAYLRRRPAPPALTSLSHKLRLLCEAGAHFVVLLPTDATVLDIPAEQFVRDVLCAKMAVRVVVVGENFRFGHRGSGGVLTFGQLSSVEGLDGVEVGTVEVAGGPVSATRIRASLAQGDVKLARELLGRPYDVHGVIRFLDPSLALLVVPAARVVPAPGKYAGSFQLHTRSRVNAFVEVTPLDNAAHGLTVHCSDRALAGERPSGLGRVAFVRMLSHARAEQA